MQCGRAVIKTAILLVTLKKIYVVNTVNCFVHKPHNKLMLLKKTNLDGDFDYKEVGDWLYGDVK